MESDRLSHPIIAEQERIWPDEEGRDFDGTFEQYAWPETHYGVTEEDDNRWLDILARERGEYIQDLTDEQRAEIVRLLNDDEAVRVFLVTLLDKYRHGTAAYGVTP